MTERTDDLSGDERELLLALGVEQDRYEARDGWDFRHTLWSRVTFTMAKARGKLAPTHIPDKFDMERGFERRFRKLVDGLVKRGLLRFKAIGAHKQPRQTLGYKGHEARVRDIFLTEAGKAVVARLREEEAPAEPDGELGEAAAVVPEPDGDVGGSPVAAVPEPDGDPGWPAGARGGAGEGAGEGEGEGAGEGEGGGAGEGEGERLSWGGGDGVVGRRPRMVARPRATRTPRRDAETRPRSGRRGR